MKFTASFSLLLASLTSVALAQNASDSATGLLEALRANNLTTLANIVGNNSAAVLPLLTGSNKTVFGPTNQAFEQAGLGGSIGNSDDPQLLATLTYHVINSTLTDDAIPDDDGEHAIVLTSLRGEPYVQLPNNRSQALVIGRGQSSGDDDDNNNGTVIQPSQNISFSLSSALRYQNVQLIPINTVLTRPGPLPATLQSLNLTMLAQLAQQTQLVQALNTTSALTVFAPTNSAIENVTEQFNAANDDQKRAVIANHVVNGTAVYSTQLSGDQAVRNATSASGEALTFEEDDDVLYVRSGDTRARIIRSDNLASNGVVHIIDMVLLNTESNPDAAASAASSASSSQATNTGGFAEGSTGDNDSDSNSGGNNAAPGAAVVGIATVGLVGLSSAALMLVA